MKIFKCMLICAAALAAASCSGKKVEMGPEEVVETFSRAVAAGDFSAAFALCDSLSMNDYLGNCRKVMNSLQKEDSSAFAIAAEILSGAEFEVTGTEKKGDERIIEYKFSVEGSEKAKRATLRKEEREWIVTSITDAI